MLICYSASYVYSKNLIKASDWKEIKKTTDPFPLLHAYKEDTQPSPARHIYISAGNTLTIFAVVIMKQCFQDG